MSSVYQTKSTIDLHLESAEFTGALDLITMSQEILRQDLRGIRSLRQFDAQFVEAEKTIDKSLHAEFIRYLISDLSREFDAGSNLLNEVHPIIFKLLISDTFYLICVLFLNKGKANVLDVGCFEASNDHICGSMQRRDLHLFEVDCETNRGRVCVAVRRRSANSKRGREQYEV